MEEIHPHQIDTAFKTVVQNHGGEYTRQNKHGSPENGGPLGSLEIPIGNHHLQVPYGSMLNLGAVP